MWYSSLFQSWISRWVLCSRVFNTSAHLLAVSGSPWHWTTCCSLCFLSCTGTSLARQCDPGQCLPLLPPSLSTLQCCQQGWLSTPGLPLGPCSALRRGQSGWAPCCVVLSSSFFHLLFCHQCLRFSLFKSNPALRDLQALRWCTVLMVYEAP